MSDVGTHESQYLHLLKPGKNADSDVYSFLIQDQETQSLLSPDFVIRSYCRPQAQALS